MGEKTNPGVRMPAFERARDLFLQRVGSREELLPMQEQARPFLMAQTGSPAVSRSIPLEFGSMEDDEESDDGDNDDTASTEQRRQSATANFVLQPLAPPWGAMSIFQERSRETSASSGMHNQNRVVSEGEEPEDAGEDLEEGELLRAADLPSWDRALPVDGTEVEGHGLEPSQVIHTELFSQCTYRGVDREKHGMDLSQVSSTESLLLNRSYRGVLKSLLSTSLSQIDLSCVDITSPRFALSRAGMRMAKSVSKLGWQLSLVQTLLAKTVYEALKANSEPTEADESLLKLFFTLFGKLKEAKAQLNESEIKRAAENESTSDTEISGTHTYFAWPVVEMAEYEFGGNADAVDFDNVVVIRNFPVLSTESQSYFELLLEGPFLSSLGKVRTINTPTDLSPEQRSKGFSFVELSSAVECDYVVKAIQNFCWGPSHKLQARHFRGFGTDKDENTFEDITRENDLSNKSPAEPAESGSRPEDVTPFKRTEMTKSLRRPNITVESWLHSRLGMATEAVASMRGGALGESLGRLEASLEEAIAAKKISELFSFDEHITAKYKSAAPNAFSSHRALLKMINGSSLPVGKKGSSEDTKTSEKTDIRTNQDEEEPDSSVMSERQLWRQCLASERFRSAALLRRLRVAEAQWSMLSKESKERWQFIAHLEQQVEAMSQQLRHEQVMKETLRMRIQEQDAYIAVQDRQSQSKLRDAIFRMRQAHDAELDRLRAEIQKDDRRREGSKKNQDEDGIVESVSRMLQPRELEHLNEIGLSAIERVLEKSITDVRKAKEECIRKQKADMEDAGADAVNSLCCICIDKPKTVVLLPCKHLCVCEECSENSRLRKCPICRKRITDTLSVFS